MSWVGSGVWTAIAGRIADSGRPVVRSGDPARLLLAAWPIDAMATGLTASVSVDLLLAEQISACLSKRMHESEIFRALADPTRRAMLDRLTAGGRNATELRDGLGVSQPAVSQHIAVLRGAGLITERRDGRHVRYSIEPDGMTPLFDWLARYRAFWPEKVDRLKTLLKEMDQ